MASRPYVIMRAQNFEPVGQQVGDTWFNTQTNQLTMALPQDGLALTWSQLLIAFNGNVGNIRSPLNTIFTTDLVGRGTISANLFLGNGSALTGVVATNVGTLPNLSVTGNVDGGNIRTVGVVSAGGTVTGSQFNGSGAGLTSIPNGALTNSAVTVNGTSISLGGSATITATATNALTIGTGLSGTSYNGSGAVTITNTGVLSLANGGGITVSASTGVITLGSTATSANTAGAIVSRGASGEFSAGVITATATNARYADLAENYTADADYAPGTVIQFGGNNEITITTTSHSTAVAGIVSTNPAYLMNHELTSDHVAAVALTGRVPCQVTGTIAKGDRLVSSSVAGVATRLDTDQYQPGCIIGKAMESYDSDAVGIIEVAVGRT